MWATRASSITAAWSAAPQADDALIARLDGIIYDLQTGEGDYGLTKNPSREFQRQLAQLKLVWESMKTAIPLVRTGQAPTAALYDLSQQHFELADQLVLYAEQNSTGKLARSIAFYFGSLVLLIAGFAIFQKKSQRELEQSVSTDKLTGLLTRAGFETKAAQLLRRERRWDWPGQDEPLVQESAWRLLL